VDFGGRGRPPSKLKALLAENPLEGGNSRPPGFHSGTKLRRKTAAASGRQRGSRWGRMGPGRTVKRLRKRQLCSPIAGRLCRKSKDPCPVLLDNFDKASSIRTSGLADRPGYARPSLDYDALGRADRPPARGQRSQSQRSGTRLSRSGATTVWQRQ